MTRVEFAQDLRQGLRPRLAGSAGAGGEGRKADLFARHAPSSGNCWFQYTGRVWAATRELWLIAGLSHHELGPTAALSP